MGVESFLLTPAGLSADRSIFRDAVGRAIALTLSNPRKQENRMLPSNQQSRGSKESQGNKLPVLARRGQGCEGRRSRHIAYTSMQPDAGSRSRSPSKSVSFFPAAPKAVSSCLSLSVVLLALGCGQAGGLQLASVEGVVTYQGKFLEHGKVVFSPQSGTPGPASVGMIQPDGSYVMRTTGREGAAIGQHKVTIHCRRELTPEEIRNRSLLIPKSLIPDRYWNKDQSPLAFEVVAGESNRYDIVLE